MANCKRIPSLRGTNGRRTVRFHLFPSWRYTYIPKGSTAETQVPVSRGFPIITTGQDVCPHGKSPRIISLFTGCEDFLSLLGALASPYFPPDWTGEKKAQHAGIDSRF